MTRPRGVRVIFPDEGIIQEDLLVTQISPHHVKLEDTPLSEAAQYGDVIEADFQADGSLLFRRVATPTTFTTFSYLLPEDVIGSRQLTLALRSVEGSGGRWELVFGGCLLLHIPSDVHVDFSRAINRAVREFRAERRHEEPLPLEQHSPSPIRGRSKRGNA